MPTRFEIDKERRLVRSYGWGEVIFADVVQHQQGLRTHPDFDPDFDQIADLTDVDSLAISAEEIQLLAHITLFSENSRRAFVAPSQLAFGMVRMFEAHHDSSFAPSTTMVFRSMSEALNWLDKKK
jgi:hypothetical protein